MDIKEIQDKLAKFAEERDWDQFHSPKNLSMALIVEAAELVEHFQWLQSEESDELTESKLTEVAEELADILIYTVRLADRLGIDIELAARDKLAKNHRKYPVNKARGNYMKYTEF